MPKCVIYIDTETTGLDVNKNSIIQIAGLIKVRGQIVDKFNFNMKPWNNEPIDPVASKVTGITDEILATYPEQADVFKQFINKLREYIPETDQRMVKRIKESEGYFDDPRALFAGYNTRFDIDFVRKWFEVNGQPYLYSSFFYPNMTFDIMQMAAFLMMNDLNRMSDFKLGTVYRVLTGGKTFEAHDAFADIEATEKVYQILRTKAKFYPFRTALGIGADMV